MGHRITNHLLIQDFATGSVVYRVETEIARQEGDDGEFDSFVTNVLPLVRTGEINDVQAAAAAYFLASRIGDGTERKTARNVMRAAYGVQTEP